MVLAVYLAIGCAGHAGEFQYINAGGFSPVPLKVIKLYVDKNFGAADQLAIDDAIMQWNYALNGYVKLQVESTSFDMEAETLQRCMVTDRCWLIMRTDSHNPMVDSLDKTKKGKSYTLAWANEIGGNRMWVIRDRVANNWMTGIALHEMGHLLGAEHDDVYLMQPMFNWEQARCVDYEALKRVAAYQHLPMDKLNYCVYGSLGLGLVTGK